MFQSCVALLILVLFTKKKMFQWAAGFWTARQGGQAKVATLKAKEA
jgi:hypothetical protein